MQHELKAQMQNKNLSAQITAKEQSGRQEILRKRPGSKGGSQAQQGPLGCMV